MRRWSRDPSRRATGRATISAPSVLRLAEEPAQAVLLVQAIEETDRGGALLSHQTRRQVTELHLTSEAADSKRRQAEAFAGRAAALLDDLDQRFPTLPKLRRWSRFDGRWTLPVAVLAGLLGLATQGLGSARQISVLAVPLMLLVAWNVAVLVLSLLYGLLPLGRRANLPAGRWIAWWQGRLLRRLPSLVPRASAKGEADEAGVAGPEGLLARSLRHFLSLWSVAQAPLLTARLRRLLHVGSMSLVGGTVLGMYLRGLVREYRVGWESTFLSGEQVDAILGVLLAPASKLLQMEIPSVALYPWPETFDAAPFIHLWAATALLFVGLPRTLAWLWETLRVRRLERRLPIRLPEAYRRRLLAAGRTVAHQVDVLPYSYQPTAKAAEQGKRLLLDVFGTRCQVRLAPSLTYGDLLDDMELPRGRCLVVVFNLAQTPEKEVHGELLRELQEELPPGQSMVVWVDSGPYRRRLQGEVVEARLDEKRAAWRRLLDTLSIEPLVLDLESPQDADLLRFPTVAWPPGSLEER